MPKHFHILAPLALTIGLFTSTATAQLDSAVGKGNISIQLPKGWSPSQVGRSLIAAQAPQPDKENSGQFLAALSITQDAATGPINGDAQQALLAKQYPSYRSIEQPATRAINGMQCIVLGGTFTINGMPLRTRQYIFSADNQLYVITFTCLNSRWAAYQPLVEESVGTFALKH